MLSMYNKRSMILNQANFVQLCRAYLEKKDKILELGIAVDTYQFTPKNQIQNETGTYIDAQQAAYIYRDFCISYNNSTPSMMDRQSTLKTGKCPAPSQKAGTS